jgi:serine/threonine-protein phosphatase PP1 catalytic subunit
MMNKEITLPQKGRLLVVTDLHGDYDSYEKYLELWDKNDENSHIVLIGDMIHSSLGFDESVEILDDVIMKSRQKMKQPIKKRQDIIILTIE